MVVHVPKRLSIDEIRQRKGDAWTEKFLTEVFGHKLTGVALDPAMVNKTYTVLRDNIGGRAGQMVPIVFRQYFFENPAAKKRMLDWLKALVEAQPAPVANGNGHVTSPAVKKRMAKMRRAKAEKAGRK